MIIIGNQKDRDINDMFSETAHSKRQFFKIDDISSSIKYVMDNIKATFPEKFIRPAKFNFECHYKLEDIERIVIDADSLEYEDYHDLATIDDLNENYFCDLIILNGKVGLRYSKFSDRDNNDYENLVFEEFDPNLENELSLMASMKEKLDHFITNEFEYDTQMNVNIKM